jgi:hypothetical protein
MKRIVHLLLAAFCLALLPVPPADAGLAQAKSCGCCALPGACGMPGCCAPAASLPAAISSARLGRLADQPPARKGRRGLPATESPSKAVLARMAARRPAAVSAVATATRGVPLFKAHCRFLI